MKELLIYLLAMIFTLNVSVRKTKQWYINHIKPGNYILKDSCQISILKNYNEINSISELLKSFKNKLVFIDMWATWCTPCVEEFEYSKPLYDYLSKNNIDMVYVSLDKEQNDSVWKEKINASQLFGFHVRASKPLQDSLTTLIWGAVDAYSIPHYLLFGKNGKLVNKDVLPPHSGIELFNQIDADLIKN
ncbi:MAG TPA: TlpA disulfide reductase family protein [Chitinophagaceae bacterium]|nr:TlpA disulfide reductase family protein [Chitinophagaceae bacterium]